MLRGVAERHRGPGRDDGHPHPAPRGGEAESRLRRRRLPLSGPTRHLTQR